MTDSLRCSIGAENLFKPVQRESTRQKVYSAIREAILNGNLKTGQRLTEIPLSKEFRVSRAVIREALQLLAHDGLVDQNAFRGSRVVHLSPEQVDEIISARLLIEPETVRLARRHATRLDKQRLRELCKRLNDASDNANLFAQLDLEFHENIWKLSGNETLCKILLQITTPLFAMGSIMRNSWRYRERQGKPEFRLGGHSAVVDKICDGSEEEAAAAMRKHISENWKTNRRHLEVYLSQDDTQDGAPVSGVRRSGSLQKVRSVPRGGLPKKKVRTAK